MSEDSTMPPPPVPKPGGARKRKARARAIDRSLEDVVADARAIRKTALERVWKGNAHPDYGAALKALELEAKLLGLLGETVSFEQLTQRLHAMGYELHPIKKAPP